MPEAEQAIQRIQQQLDEFSAKHGQTNLPAYKQVLSDRIIEISKQKSELANDIAETQGYIGQLQTRLSTVQADLSLPARLLAQNETYQSVWQELLQSEDQLLEEYSQANIDATKLNQIYTVYRKQQQKLQRADQDDLSNYQLKQGAEATEINYEAHAALEIMQALVVAVHQERVQMLRSDTIDSIEQRLQLRQQTLTQNITTYETLQRELGENQAIVQQYKAERDRINASAAGQQLAASQSTAEADTSAELSPAIQQASQLRLKLEDGTVAKALLGIVVAAGCIAAATRRRKKAIAVPVLNQLPQPALPPSQLLMPNRVRSQPLALAPAYGSLPSSNASDSSLLEEMIAVIEEKSSAIVEPPIEELDLSIEIMARELNRVLEKTSAESRFAEEVAARNINPVRISLEDIDIFAEKAIQWALQDLEKSLPIGEIYPKTVSLKPEYLSLPTALRPSLEKLQLAGRRLIGPRFAMR